LDVVGAFEKVLPCEEEKEGLEEEEGV